MVASCDCIIHIAGTDSYGHPDGETRERLSACGIPLYCTIECGEINLTLEEGRVEVKCPYRKKSLNNI